MKRISTATRVPNKFGAGKDGYTDGDVIGGVPATDLEGALFDNLQEELANIVEATGVALDGTKLSQVVTALRSNGLLYGVDSGAANACVLTYAPVVATLVDGMVLWFKAAATNTGATTLNVNGLGVKAVVGGANTALQGGEIVANGKCMVVWNATLNSFVLIECTGAALQVGTGTKSQHAATVGQAGFQNIAVYKIITGAQNVSVNGAAFTPTGAGSFTVPPSGVFRSRVWGPGGGSGGTFGGSSGSQGGAGGGYAEAVATSTPGTSVAITVGVHGARGFATATPSAGTAGTTSSVGAFASATSGAGGTAASGGIASGTSTPGSGSTVGGGFTASGGSPSQPFSLGGGLIYTATGGAGAQGGATAHAGAQAVSSAGQPGKFPGGGASGSVNQADGGDGADGQIIIEY
jgi:hypothetical protein